MDDLSSETARDVFELEMSTTSVVYSIKFGKAMLKNEDTYKFIQENSLQSTMLN